MKSLFVGIGVLGVFTVVSAHIHPHGVPYWYFIGAAVIYVLTCVSIWHEGPRG